MAKLLTGKKALLFDRPKSDRNLAMYFVYAVKEDRLLKILKDHIFNDSNIEQLKEVANLAIRCLRVRGEDRPSTKESRNGVGGVEKHPWGWGNADVYVEEISMLLHTLSTLMLALAILLAEQLLGTIAWETNVDRNSYVSPEGRSRQGKKIIKKRL